MHISSVIKISFCRISFSGHQNKFCACLDSIYGSRVILVMCKNCSAIRWHRLNSNQSKTNCPKNLNSDGLIIREMGPWPECIFRSLLQFLVSYLVRQSLRLVPDQVQWLPAAWARTCCGDPSTADWHRRLGPDRFHGYKYTGYVLCFDGVIFGLEIVRFRHKSGLFITPSIMTTEDTKTYLAKREIPQLFEVSRHVVTTFEVSAHLPWCATMLLSDWSMNAPATDK